MDSMKNQSVSTLIICFRPWFENYEDFRSVKFRDSPIVVLGNSIEEDDNGHPYPDNIHPLVLFNNEKREDASYEKCVFCSNLLGNTTDFFLIREDFGHSIIYDLYFHRECMEPITNNPYHLKHSLQILVFMNVTSNKVCYCCYQYQSFLHYCSICNFSICRDCVKKPLLLTIDHQKRHQHTLSYFPREASMTCDVCALDERRYFLYVCPQLDFVVHKECVFSPYIIKISRHKHRLSFTSSFSHGEWFCGVCRKKIDENYGGYSCMKSCYFVAHSKCATHKDVWDGKELEGEPEELYEDSQPLKEISDGIIQHFSHKHHMRLHKKIDKTIEDNKRCQVCALPIFDGDVFNCMECDFIFHKVCAYLPLKIQHSMHRHPLVLQEGILHNIFTCSACYRSANCFSYVCQMAKCGFALDVNCATVSVPLNHLFHPHPLFLPSIPGYVNKCSICQTHIYLHLDCEECEFVFCFSCATLPVMLRYKHDEHPLILSLEQDVSNQHWCEICEEEIYLKSRIYMCNDCGIILHIECLLGKDVYILPSKKITYGAVFNILPNYSLTRYICKKCNKRCQDKVVYKKSDETIRCSLTCVYNIIDGVFKM